MLASFMKNRSVGAAAALVAPGTLKSSFHRDQLQCHQTPVGNCPGPISNTLVRLAAHVAKKKLAAKKKASPKSVSVKKATTKKKAETPTLKKKLVAKKKAAAKKTAPKKKTSSPVAAKKGTKKATTKTLHEILKSHRSSGNSGARQLTAEEQQRFTRIIVSLPSRQALGMKAGATITTPRSRRDLINLLMKFPDPDTKPYDYLLRILGDFRWQVRKTSLSLPNQQRKTRRLPRSPLKKKGGSRSTMMSTTNAAKSSAFGHRLELERRVDWPVRPTPVPGRKPGRPPRVSAPAEALPPAPIFSASGFRRTRKNLMPLNPTRLHSAPSPSGSKKTSKKSPVAEAKKKKPSKSTVSKRALPQSSSTGVVDLDSQIQLSLTQTKRMAKSVTPALESISDLNKKLTTDAPVEPEEKDWGVTVLENLDQEVAKLRADSLGWKPKLIKKKSLGTGVPARTLDEYHEQDFLAWGIVRLIPAGRATTLGQIVTILEARAMMQSAKATAGFISSAPSAEQPVDLTCAFQALSSAHEAGRLARATGISELMSEVSSAIVKCPLPLSMVPIYRVVKRDGAIMNKFHKVEHFALLKKEGCKFMTPIPLSMHVDMDCLIRPLRLGEISGRVGRGSTTTVVNAIPQMPATSSTTSSSSSTVTFGAEHIGGGNSEDDFAAFLGNTDTLN